MLFKATSVTNSLSRSKVFEDSDSMGLELAPKWDDILEISTDCVICHPGLFRLHYEREGKRALLAPTLWIRRGKSVDRILPKKIVDSPCWTNAVGAMKLYRSKYEGPSLYFEVSLNPRTFDALAQSVVSDAIPTEISIRWDTCYEDSKMEFGWEPDGRRQIWNLPEGESGHWPIEEIGFATKIRGAQDEAEEIEESVSQEKPASNRDDASSLRTPAVSLDSLVTEVRKVNEQIARTSKLIKVLVFLVAVIGVMLLGTR